MIEPVQFFGEREHVEASVSSARSKLERILSEYSEYFISGADRKFITELIKETEEHINEESGLVNANKQPAMHMFNFSRYQLAVLNRVIEHAEYFRDTREVRYKFGSEFLNSEGVKEKTHSSSSRYLTKDDIWFLASIAKSVDSGYPLSTKQILAVEGILSRANRKKSQEEDGMVYLNPKEDIDINNYVCRIMHFGLGRKRKTHKPSDEDVITFRKKYAINGKIDFTELKRDLFGVIKTSRRVHLVEEYERAFLALHNYLTKINPDNYKIGFNYSVPKVKNTP